MQSCDNHDSAWAATARVPLARVLGVGAAVAKANGLREGGYPGVNTSRQVRSTLQIQLESIQPSPRDVIRDFFVKRV